jgi:DNA-binding NarL/FixJ family response regulator
MRARTTHSGSPLGPIRLVMVEPRPLVATGVRRILDQEWDIDVVGQASSPEEAQSVVIATAPDVILIDGSVDEAAGNVATRRLRRATPDAAYVVLGGQDDDASILEAVEIGAMAHISEVAQPAELVDIIRQVAYGGDPLQEELRDRPDLVGRALGDLRDTPTIADLQPSPLTARESEVLHLVALGLKNREIADRLQVAEQTVKNQLRAVTRKLEAPNRTVAVMTAIRNGWLVAPEEIEAT